MPQILLVLLLVPLAFDSPKPAPPSKIPDKIAAKAGDLIVISVDGDPVAFVYDLNAFPTPKRSIAEPKRLTLTTPTNGSYTVVVVDQKLTQLRIAITVTGGVDPVPVPPDDPPETPTLLQLIKDLTGIVAAQGKKIDALTASMAALDARVAALEGAKPPPPPPSPAILKHLTFIGPELNPISLAINNDVGLRGILGKAGVSVHVLKANDPQIVTKGFGPIVLQAGGAPCVVLQDGDAKVIGSGPMTSLQQVTDLAAKFIRR